MALCYCFEASRVLVTLSAYKRNDLAVINTEGRESLVMKTVNRSVYVHKYLNKLKTEYSKL